MDGMCSFDKEGDVLMNGDGDMIQAAPAIRSWGFSVALHAAVCGLCWWMTSQQVMTPSSMFQWDVSLVSLSRSLSTDGSVSAASMQGGNPIRSVVTKSVRNSESAAPSVDRVVDRTAVAPESVPSETEVESNQSVVAVAVPTPDKANDSPTVPSSDMAAPHQTIEESQSTVDGEKQGPPVSTVQSVVAVDQRADGSADPSTEGSVPSSALTHGGSSGAAPDVGWLMQMLWGRVTELKHYPSEARMNRWEGRVVVRVVIDEQGRLLDATIALGSGYVLLDHAALDVIRRSCPLSLPHALGRRQIVLRVPIQYKLDS